MTPRPRIRHLELNYVATARYRPEELLEQIGKVVPDKLEKLHHGKQQAWNTRRATFSGAEMPKICHSSAISAKLAVGAVHNTKLLLLC